MLTVHHLGISQSERIVWLCEELGVDYVIKRYDRDPATRLAPAAYKALHPAGTAPVITDGALCLGESGAIIDYIIARYGNGALAVPPAAPEFPDYLYWFHFANASLMPSAMARMITASAGIGAENPVARVMQAREVAAFAQIERRLAEAAYFAGDSFTAADIMMSFPLTTMRLFMPTDLSGAPHTTAYLARIAARPAYQRAMQKADPGLDRPLG
jgi:glutathione S-transferase